MKFNVRSIGGEYQEMKVDAIETGTMNKKEAIQLAQQMVSAAEDLLWGCGIKDESAMCASINESLEECV